MILALAMLEQGSSPRPAPVQADAVHPRPPLGLPICCQPVAGNRSDTPLSVPAYDVLIVGDSKMTDLPTRGHVVAHSSRYLGAYRPIHATSKIAGWVGAALAHTDTWVEIETADRRTGEVHLDAVIGPFDRSQTWVDPTTQQAHTWTERVLVVSATAYQAGLRRLRAQALERLTPDLLKVAQPPVRGRKRYPQEAELAAVIAKRIVEAKLDGVVQTELASVALRDGNTAWVLAAVWVDLAAWQAEERAPSSTIAQPDIIQQEKPQTGHSVYKRVYKIFEG